MTAPPGLTNTSPLLRRTGVKKVKGKSEDSIPLILTFAFYLFTFAFLLGSGLAVRRVNRFGFGRAFLSEPDG